MIPKLIVFEGVDGSGKTLISRMFANWLRAQNGVGSVFLTHEPFEDAAAGQFIREVLRKQITVFARTLALAFAANRMDHCDRWMIPALLDKAHVVCDRYVLSSLVYQVVDDLYPAEIADLNREALVPDLTFILTVTAETHRARMANRGGAVERFDEQFEAISERYRSAPEWLPETVAASGTMIVIDANGTPEEVLAKVIGAWNDANTKLLTDKSEG